MLSRCVLAGACPMDPKSGPPGGPNFGSVFYSRGSKYLTILNAACAAAPFWGPPGRPQNGSTNIKYVSKRGRQTAPVWGPFFIFENPTAKTNRSPRPRRSHFGVRLADPEMGPQLRIQPRIQLRIHLRIQPRIHLRIQPRIHPRNQPRIHNRRSKQCYKGALLR